jgi:hypothetical protein
MERERKRATGKRNANLPIEEQAQLKLLFQAPRQWDRCWCRLPGSWRCWRCWLRSREAGLLRVKSPNRSSGVVASAGWAGQLVLQGGPGQPQRASFDGQGCQDPGILRNMLQRHRSGAGLCWEGRYPLPCRRNHAGSAGPVPTGRHTGPGDPSDIPSDSRLPDRKVPPKKKFRHCPAMRHGSW